jgi:hypothetical protein
MKEVLPPTRDSHHGHAHAVAARLRVWLRRCQISSHFERLESLP